MPVSRSGYAALVNWVWGLVAGGLPVTSRTVTTQGGTVTSVGTVTGNVNGAVLGGVTGNLTGHVTGGVGGDLGGNVVGFIGGALGGNVNGSVLGNVNGSVGSVLAPVTVAGPVTPSGGTVTTVTGNVVGSVGSVVAPVTLAVGSPGTIRRRLKGVTMIGEPNTVQTHALGVTVVEALCAVRFLGMYANEAGASGGVFHGDGAVELFDANNVRVYRAGAYGQTYVRWELTEYWG